MEEVIKSLLVQFPMVAIILLIFWQQTKAHEVSIAFYRQQQNVFMTWLLEMAKQGLIAVRQAEHPASNETDP